MQDKKQSLVPELRFPGFEGEWKNVKIKDLFKITRGKVLAMQQVSNKCVLPFIYPVFSSQTMNGGLAGYYNDYLYENAITWTTDGANAGEVNYRAGKFYCTNVCGVLLSDDGYANLCIASILGLVAKLHVSYVGNPKLMNNVMAEIEIAVPPSFAEQQKIAECLSSVDDLIQAEADQLQALKDHKKGLMQQLFPQEGETTPKLRFPGFEGEWEEKKFNDIFSLLSNNTCSRAEMDNNIGVALNVHYGDILTKYNEILDVQKTNIPYVTDNDLLVKYKDSFLQDGDIIISDTAEDSTVGKCTEIQNHQEIIILSGLHTIPVRPQRKFAKGYLGYFLNSESYHNQLLPLMQGAKVSSISRTAIKKTEIFFPSLPEQQKIASCLSSLDEGIAAQQRKVEALKEHKKGLMQKLFPNLQ